MVIHLTILLIPLLKIKINTKNIYSQSNTHLMYLYLKI